MYGWKAGSTYPTAMLSCYMLYSVYMLRLIVVTAKVLKEDFIINLDKQDVDLNMDEMSKVSNSKCMYIEKLFLNYSVISV